MGVLNGLASLTERDWTASGNGAGDLLGWLIGVIREVDVEIDVDGEESTGWEEVLEGDGCLADLRMTLGGRNGFFNTLSANPSILCDMSVIV